MRPGGDVGFREPEQLRKQWPQLAIPKSVGLQTEQAADVADPGDVGQHVNFANLLRGVRARCLAEHIQREKTDAQSRGDRWAGVLVAVGEPDSRASAGKTFRDGRADARCPP